MAHALSFKPQIRHLFVSWLIFSALSASAAILYVDVNSATPTPPFDHWATAARTIQEAVDAATGRDQILVTNGVYRTGGRFSDGSTNRVSVTKPATIQSVNGADVTVIDGDKAGRCVYLGNGAVMDGFTITNGMALYGGGVSCESTNSVLSNCVLSGNATSPGGFGDGGGARGGTLFRCLFRRNSADSSGGGASQGTLLDCILEGNFASSGGGAFECILNHCTITNNSAGAGSGTAQCTLNGCTLIGNSAAFGGGAIAGQINGGGGIATGLSLNNCTISGNSAEHSGGGAYNCLLNNCTVTGNSAGDHGGGAAGSTFNNCIVWYNRAPVGANYSDTDSLLGRSLATFNYSSTWPFPWNGVGNLGVEPQLTDISHLRSTSPCRGAGSAAHAAGLDIDGEAWVSPPSMGCDEYHSNLVGSPLSVSIEVPYTNVAVGFIVRLGAMIGGHATSNRWEFGDGSVTEGQPYQTFVNHAWVKAGDYSVVFHAYNATHPDGMSATITLHVVPRPVHYVALNNAKPVAPYTSWATAGTNIQDVVGSTTVPGALVIVSNGVYRTGGVAVYGGRTNRLAVVKPVTVQSMNGAALTVIDGRGDAHSSDDSAVRCVYLSDGAALIGFTLTNGLAQFVSDVREEYGGGVWCESDTAIISHCILSGNSADGYGGGASGGTLNDCVLTGNTATKFGGGAYGSRLNNCVLIGNFTCFFNGADSYFNGGGGASRCVINNSILYYNTAGDEVNNYAETSLSYCCTIPLPTNGFGNFVDPPLSIDYAGGNFRLQSHSPCINAGSNASAPAGPDLDGNPRIAGGTVDIGAYEFPSPRSLISYAWLQQYGLPTDGSADNTDADGDGLNNWQEWRAGTDPTNALSALRLRSPAVGAPGLSVSWQSVSSRSYYLERSTDLGAQPPFVLVATALVGRPGMTTFKDTNAVGAGPFFYRVGVQE